MAPASSSSRIWNRACWPPDSVSNRCSAQPWQLVAAEHAHGRAADDVTPFEDLEQRGADQLGVVVGLVEVAGHDPGAEAHVAGVLDAVVAGQQPQEVALAGAVGPEHGDALAVPDLGVERVGQARPARGPRW